MTIDPALTDIDRAYLEYGRAAFDLFEQPDNCPDAEIDERYLTTKKRVAELRARARITSKGAPQ
jgi:hypothetical protein